MSINQKSPLLLWLKFISKVFITTTNTLHVSCTSILLKTPTFSRQSYLTLQVAFTDELAGRLLLFSRCLHTGQLIVLLHYT